MVSERPWWDMASPSDGRAISPRFSSDLRRGGDGPGLTVSLTLTPFAVQDKDGQWYPAIEGEIHERIRYWPQAFPSQYLARRYAVDRLEEATYAALQIIHNWNLRSL